MTARQAFLKLIYPLIMKMSQRKGKDEGVKINTDHAPGSTSFYTLKAELTDKSTFDFSGLKGRKVLIVNVASNCGFTPQYNELEELSERYRSSLIILGFPANDFKGQEPGDDETIEKFCRVGYNVSFPIFAKAPVLNPHQQPVFSWLSNKDKNGWNDEKPSWNFCKYLINESGDLMATIKPYVSPLDQDVVKMIETPVAKVPSDTR